MNELFHILLYYKYTPFDDPDQLCAAQKELCQKLDLKGRIIISSEGINGTVAGSNASIEAYIKETSSISGLEDMEWKRSTSPEQVFPKLRVVVRDEIVTLGIQKTGVDVSITNTAEYIEPAELNSMYENNEDFIIIDARNSYEHQIGKFVNAVIPAIDNFRDFPAFVKTLEKYKQKKVVTYCTGGVRCEKASAYLREQGFSDIKQLHGGIHEYGKQTGGKFFEGEMFVFDKRLHVTVNEVNPSTVGICIYCQTSITRLTDCARPGCDELFVCCSSCEQKHHSMCSAACSQLDLQTNTTRSAPDLQSL